MKSKKKNQPGPNAVIADFAAYKARSASHQRHSGLSPQWSKERVELTKTSCLRSIENRHSPAIAYAGVALALDGTVTLTAHGIEPEFASAIASGLLTLSERIQAHDSPSPRPSNSPSGRADMSFLLSLAFAAATYINAAPWLDSALVLAAQATAHWLASRGRRDH